MASKPAIVFVSQPGELATKAALLATSLRRFAGSRFDLYAATPNTTDKPALSGELLPRLLDVLDVARVPITNPVDSSYPIANKIAALGVPETTRGVVLLDSDVVCMDAIPASLFDGELLAKPADFRTWPTDGDSWKAVWDAMQLSPPVRRVTATITGELMPPYFNSGVVATRCHTALSECWAQVCRELDVDVRIGNKRPWLDQIGLPVAAERLRLRWRTLPERLNFPAHVRRLSDRRVALCHYHSPTTLSGERRLRELVASLCDEQPLLRDLLLLGGEEWKALARERPATRSRSGAVRTPFFRWTKPTPPIVTPAAGALDVVVTGIPRSGTSLLCRLLHESPNWVVINEPTEVFDGLAANADPLWVRRYYDELRARILRGEPVENKVRNGRVIEDTWMDDARTSYLPRVSGPAFALGTKNTLAYLARIRSIRAAMPDSPILVCLRNPIDTVSSWIGTFGHLREVRLESFPVLYQDLDYFDAQSRVRLDQIANAGSLSLRRALLWSHLAHWVDSAADEVTVLRYEDLTSNPRRELARITSRVGLRAHVSPFSRLRARTQRRSLNQEEIDLIRDVCGPIADRFGYDI